MSDFAEWMLVDQMRHILNDWNGIRERERRDGREIDVMVLRVVAAVSNWAIERAIPELEALTKQRDAALAELAEHRAEADAQLASVLRLRNEIDCRIEHGVDSNGHLEAIREFIMGDGHVNV